MFPDLLPSHLPCLPHPDTSCTLPILFPSPFFLLRCHFSRYAPLMFFTFPLTFLAFPLTFPALTARTFPTLSLTSFPALSACRVFFFPLCSPRISCLFKQLADESINYLVFLRVYRAKLKHCMSINGHLIRRDTVSWPGRRQDTQERRR